MSSLDSSLFTSLHHRLGVVGRARGGNLHFLGRCIKISFGTSYARHLAVDIPHSGLLLMFC